MPNIPDTASLTVRRFETYPEENPDRWVIGITLELPNSRTEYREHTIPMTDAQGMTNEEIRDAAIQALKPDLETWAGNNAAAPPFVSNPEQWSNVEARLIPAWEVGLYWGTQAEYDAYTGDAEYGGRRAFHEGTVYETIDGQGHVAQSPDWTPPNTPALWQEVN